MSDKRQTIGARIERDWRWQYRAEETRQLMDAPIISCHAVSTFRRVRRSNRIRTRTHWIPVLWMREKRES